MKKKKLVTLAAVTAMAASMLAGCGSSDTGSTSSSAGGQEEGKGNPTPVNLVLYGEESQRMSDFAQNELHQKVEDAINVDLTISYLPWSEYAGGKTELMLSSGEKFVTYTDTAFLSKCVSKGYYADLTDAAEKYAGDLKKYCGGEEMFDIWKVDGRLYALPFGNLSLIHI